MIKHGKKLGVLFWSLVIAGMMTFGAAAQPKVFFNTTSAGKSALFKANLDLSNPGSFISTSSIAREMAWDSVGERLFWINETSKSIESTVPGAEDPQVTTVLTGLVAPSDLAIDSSTQTLYFFDDYLTSGRAIYRADLGGTNKQLLVAAGAVSPGRQSLALDTVARKIYFTENNGMQFYSANLDDGSNKTFEVSESVATPKLIKSLAVDTKRSLVYYCMSDTATETSILKKFDPLTSPTPGALIHSFDGNCTDLLVEPETNVMYGIGTVLQNSPATSGKEGAITVFDLDSLTVKEQEYTTDTINGIALNTKKREISPDSPSTIVNIIPEEPVPTVTKRTVTITLEPFSLASSSSLGVFMAHASSTVNITATVGFKYQIQVRQVTNARGRTAKGVVRNREQKRNTYTLRGQKAGGYRTRYRVAITATRNRVTKVTSRTRWSPKATYTISR